MLSLKMTYVMQRCYQSMSFFFLLFFFFSLDVCSVICVLGIAAKCSTKCGIFGLHRQNNQLNNYAVYLGRLKLLLINKSDVFFSGQIFQKQQLHDSHWITDNSFQKQAIMNTNLTKLRILHGQVQLATQNGTIMYQVQV